jgi:hypothetical protein
MTRSTSVAAAVLAFATSASYGQSQPVQWRVEDGGNGHWYQLRQMNSLSWTTHRDACTAIGGHLATVTSSGESSFVKALVPTNVSGGLDYLFGPTLGLYQPSGSAEPNGGWRWVTNEPLSFQDWFSGEPNNGPGGGENWVRLRRNGSAFGWNDVAQSVPSGDPFVTMALIEWSADCNGDSIVDYGQIRNGQLVDADGDYVPDCCEAGVPCNPISAAAQWRTADGGNGHWYGVVAGSGGCWTQHRQLAEQAGGHLVTLTTASESAFVESLTTAEFLSLGGIQLPDACEPECGWTWITGEPWIYTRWDAGQPEDFGGQNGGQDLLVRTTNGWHDASECPPYAGTGYIVEWSADCNNDGLVDYGQILSGQLSDFNGDGVPNICQCPADVSGNGQVNGVDLAAILGAWGTNGQNQFACDINRDGIVNGQDLAFVLGGWGPCP